MTGAKTRKIIDTLSEAGGSALNRDDEKFIIEALSNLARIQGAALSVPEIETRHAKMQAACEHLGMTDPEVCPSIRDHADRGVLLDALRTTSQMCDEAQAEAIKSIGERDATRAEWSAWKLEAGKRTDERDALGQELDLLRHQLLETQAELRDDRRRHQKAAVDRDDLRAQLARLESAPMADAVREIEKRQRYRVRPTQTSQDCDTLLDAYRAQSLALSDAGRDYMRAMNERDTAREQLAILQTNFENLCRYAGAERDRLKGELVAKEAECETLKREVAAHWDQFHQGQHNVNVYLEGVGRILADRDKQIGSARALLQELKVAADGGTATKEAATILNALLAERDEARAQLGQCAVSKPENTEERDRLAGELGANKEIPGLREQLRLTKLISNDYKRVLDAIPECQPHGPGCVPYALEWVAKMKKEASQ